MHDQLAPDDKAQLSADGPRSLTEWVVLGLLTEEPAHGFALAKELSAGHDLGRILTVRRPLVYRALDRLVEIGLVAAVSTEPGDGGPTRTVHQATRAGHAMVARWLAVPVDHVRDLRVEFLVKLRLLERGGADSRPLVASQRLALDHTLAGLAARGDDGDVVDRWRATSAEAAARFLGQLG